MRPDLEGFDQDAGMADLLEDVGAVEGLGVVEEDLESTAKAYYDMEAAKEHLHEKTRISKLDAI